MAQSEQDKVDGSIEIGQDHPSHGFDQKINASLSGEAASLLRQAAVGPKDVSLLRTHLPRTQDLPLWLVIRRSTDAISFENYRVFMNWVLCQEPPPGMTAQQATQQLGNPPPDFDLLSRRRFLPFNDTDAYRLLKVATEAFLTVNCGVAGQPLNAFTSSPDDIRDAEERTDLSFTQQEIDDDWRKYLIQTNGTDISTLPYLVLIRNVLKNEPLKDEIFLGEYHDRFGTEFPQQCIGILKRKLTNPCLFELIWSYWHEQGMLMQTINAISLRFQNVRHGGWPDPLALMEIDPLRPLNNLLWGYIQDEQHRLTILRRVYEYDHHYGLTLQGKAIPALRPADSRSRFLEAFHNLLYQTALFFREDDDATVLADGFPVLNALKDVHFLLAEGAHNQFGDLPSTARQEMLMVQWLLHRPEFLQFLPTRIMVAYPEPWMDKVDAMKSVQGWTDVSVLHFRNLGVFGEKILLSIRFGNWNSVNDRNQASLWARFWRTEIQGYIHAYRAATGVDLTAELTSDQRLELRYIQPALLLQRRLVDMRRQREYLPQQRRLQLPR